MSRQPRLELPRVRITLAELPWHTHAGAGEGEADLAALQQHAFFAGECMPLLADRSCAQPLRQVSLAGTDWEGLRGCEAPELAPAPEQPKEFDWELSSLAAQLPSFITGGGDPGSPSLSKAAAAVTSALLGSSPTAGSAAAQPAAGEAAAAEPVDRPGAAGQPWSTMLGSSPEAGAEPEQPAAAEPSAAEPERQSGAAGQQPRPVLPGSSPKAQVELKQPGAAEQAAEGPSSAG